MPIAIDGPAASVIAGKNIPIALPREDFPSHRHGRFRDKDTWDMTFAIAKYGSLARAQRASQAIELLRHPRAPQILNLAQSVYGEPSVTAFRVLADWKASNEERRSIEAMIDATAQYYELLSPLSNNRILAEVVRGIVMWDPTNTHFHPSQFLKILQIIDSHNLPYTSQLAKQAIAVVRGPFEDEIAVIGCFLEQNKELSLMELRSLLQLPDQSLSASARKDIERADLAARWASAQTPEEQQHVVGLMRCFIENRLLLDPEGTLLSGFVETIAETMKDPRNAGLVEMLKEIVEAKIPKVSARAEKAIQALSPTPPFEYP